MKNKDDDEYLSVPADHSQPDRAILDKLREEAERRYPRKGRVLARRLNWPPSKLSKVLNGSQPAVLVDVVLLCTALHVPLSHIAKAAGA